MNIEYVDNHGKIVICDFCNADGDAVDGEGNSTNMGGMLMGSHAVCGRCCEKNEYILSDGTLNMAHFEGEPVDNIRILDANKSFGDNVRAWRKEVHGTEDAISSFITFDSNDEMFDFLTKKGNK
jgi:hypothetical protein